jgi:mRNA interferase MazF
MSPRPGEVWLADLGLAAKRRPVVVVSRHDPDPPRALAIYVPLTTQDRQSRYEVPIPKVGFLDAVSVANVQGVASIPLVRLEKRLGKLPEKVVSEIHRALRFALDLTEPSR